MYKYSVVVAVGKILGHGALPRAALAACRSRSRALTVCFVDYCVLCTLLGKACSFTSQAWDLGSSRNVGEGHALTSLFTRILRTLECLAYKTVVYPSAEKSRV